MHDDDRYMDRVLDLARRPGHTSPNPRVAAVIVWDGSILAEGIHEGAGSPHAETLALREADARGATLYVNLEPCNHQGRTPPCVPALIEAGIARVVVALQDPDPRVAGRGLARLREAGVEVTMGVLEGAARALNAPYLHHRETSRTYLTLKLALSLDGRLGAPDGSSRWITGERARARVHARRLEADAVLVGAGTVVKDDPSLTVRHVVADRQPLRVVVDSSGRVPVGSAVFREPGEVLMATTARCPHEVQTAWKAAGAEVVVFDRAEDGGVDLDALLAHLGCDERIETYCEGGAGLATSLLRSDLVERLELYRGPLMLGGKGPGIGPLGIESMSDVVAWHTLVVEQLDEDTLVILQRRR